MFTRRTAQVFAAAVKTQSRTPGQELANLICLSRSFSLTPSFLSQGSSAPEFAGSNTDQSIFERPPRGSSLATSFAPRGSSYTDLPFSFENSASLEHTDRAFEQSHSASFNEEYAAGSHAKFSGLSHIPEELRSDLQNYGEAHEHFEAIFQDLHPSIQQRLRRKGIDKLFPIQANSYPIINANLNLVGKARTGTGKTLAFVLPIANKIMKTQETHSPDVERLRRIHGSSRKRLSCLIMTPTRELCKQIETNILETAPELNPVSVYGGTPMGNQIRQLQHGAQIVVATPGRLLDLYERNAISFNDIEYLVLDEADTMLDFGFEKDIRFVLDRLNSLRARNSKPLQISFFSATMPDFINKSIDNYLNVPSPASEALHAPDSPINPVFLPMIRKLVGKNNYALIDLVGDNANATKTSLNVSLYKLRMPAATDRALVQSIAYLADKFLAQTPASAANQLPSAPINSSGYKKVIVFSQRKIDVSNVAQLLNNASSRVPALNNFRAYELHGDIQQSRREHILSEFKNERRPHHKFLVCTDVAARGLDINNVDLVINLEPPLNNDNFVHRSGRTGRAGKSGVCVTLYKPSEGSSIPEIEKFVKRKLEDATPDYEAAFRAKAVRNIDSPVSEIFKSLMTPTASLLCNQRDYRTVMAVLPVGTGRPNMQHRSRFSSPSRRSANLDEHAVNPETSNESSTLSSRFEVNGDEWFGLNTEFDLHAANSFVQRHFSPDYVTMKNIHLTRVPSADGPQDAIVFDLPIDYLAQQISEKAFSPLGQAAAPDGLNETKEDLSLFNNAENGSIEMSINTHASPPTSGFVMRNKESSEPIFAEYIGKPLKINGAPDVQLQLISTLPEFRHDRFATKGSSPAKGRGFGGGRGGAGGRGGFGGGKGAGGPSSSFNSRSQNRFDQFDRSSSDSFSGYGSRGASSGYGSRDNNGYRTYGGAKDTSRGSSSGNKYSEFNF